MFSCVCDEERFDICKAPHTCYLLQLNTGETAVGWKAHCRPPVLLSCGRAGKRGVEHRQQVGPEGRTGEVRLAPSILEDFEGS